MVMDTVWSETVESDILMLSVLVTKHLEEHYTTLQLYSCLWMFRYLSTNTSKRQKVDWLSSVCEISLHYMKEMEQDSDSLCGGGVRLRRRSEW